MRLEQLTKALADQTRLRIVMLLAAKAELCVCDLTATLEMAQPKVSRHLAILRESHLLKGKKRGLWVYYSLHPDLAPWAAGTVNSLYSGSQQDPLYQQDLQRLKSLNLFRKCC